MDNTYILFSLITIFYLVRIIILTTLNKSVKHLYFSYFLFTIPFELGKSIIQIGAFNVSGTLSAGCFIYFPALTLLFFFYLIFGVKYVFNKSSYKQNEWVYYVCVLTVISLIYNSFFTGYLKGGFIFAFFFFNYISLFVLLSKICTIDILIKGIFDGFILLSALQVILAICFPLLGINFVTGLFHTYGTEWSTRLGGREGALGFFGHPGNFAIYLIISSSFFLGSYFEGFNKRKCQLFICINTFSLYLTYSRISFLSFIGILFILFLIKSNPKKSLFTFKNVLFYVLPAFLVIYFIVFESSLSDLFLKGDANQQVDNRMVHWIVSTKIFFESPLLGVGLNSHLAYISKNTGLINSLTSDDFFSKNPIHNIHLIVLSELGIIGFICWVVFLISNIAIAKKNIANDSNNILSFTLIGVVLAYIFNGVTGWGPLSPSLLPFFLFFCFFARKFSV